MINQEHIYTSEIIQEEERELVAHLGDPFQSFSDNLVRRATTGTLRKSTIIFVGGLSETGKTALVTQAVGDFSDNPRVRIAEEKMGTSFRHLHIDLGDANDLFENRFRARYSNDDVELPQLGHYSASDYADIAAGLTQLVAYSAHKTTPQVIWVQSTLLPGLLNKNGEVEGLDKGLSTAASMVANSDPFVVLMFGSFGTRKRGAAFKEEIIAASPLQVPEILARFDVQDTRSPAEIIAYTKDHSSNARSRRQSLEMVRLLTRTLVESGEMEPIERIFGETDDPDIEMVYLRTQYGRAFLDRLYGGSLDPNRAFTMFNDVLPQGKKLHVVGSIYESGSLVRAMEAEARTTSITSNRELLYALGIRG